MTGINVESPDGVECQTILLKLALTADLLDDLIRRGRGAVWYQDLRLPDGAVFVSAWHQDGMAIAAFHVEVARPSVARSFALAPIHHSFKRDVGVEVRPLAMVVVPHKPGTILLTLYEAINAVGAFN